MAVLVKCLHTVVQGTKVGDEADYERFVVPFMVDKGG